MRIGSKGKMRMIRFGHRPPAGIHTLTFWWVLLTLSLGGGDIFAAESDRDGEIYYDLTELSPGSNGVKSLRGEADFFWGQLLTPDDLSANRYFNPRRVQIPDSWTHYQVDGQPLPPFGCATYRFYLILPPSMVPGSEPFGMLIPTIHSSSRIWVNDTPVASTGHVSLNPYDSRAYPQRSIVQLEGHNPGPGPDTVQIVVQVGNFVSPSAGITMAPSVGNHARIVYLDGLYQSVMHMLLGAVMAFLLLRFLMRPWRRNVWQMVWFILMSLFCTTRILTGGTSLLLQWIPETSWSAFYKIRYLSNVGMTTSIMLFFTSLYPIETNRFARNTLTFLGMVLIVYVLVTPSRVFAGTPWLFTLHLILLGAFVLGWVLPLAIRHRRKIAIRALVGISAVALALILDQTLSSHGLANYRPLIALALVLFYTMVVWSMLEIQNRKYVANERRAQRLSQTCNEQKAQLDMKDLRYAEQKRRLSQNQEKQRIQAWMENGIMTVSNTLVKNRSRLQELCDAALHTVATYVEANVAAVFLAKYDGTSFSWELHLTSGYGLSHEQLSTNSILQERQGLVGACYSDNTFQHITNLPENFFHITSGLGSGVPPSLVLVPLEADSGMVGVLELGRTMQFEKHELNFIRKIAPLLANYIVQSKSIEDALARIRKLEEEATEREREMEILQNRCATQLERKPTPRDPGNTPEAAKSSGGEGLFK